MKTKKKSNPQHTYRETLLRYSYRRSRRAYAVYFAILLMTFTCALSAVVFGVADFATQAMFVCLGGMMLFIWGIATSSELHKQQQFRRSLGVGLVQVPVAEKHKRKRKPDQLRTIDGTTLEVIEHDDNDDQLSAGGQ